MPDLRTDGYEQIVVWEACVGEPGNAEGHAKNLEKMFGLKRVPRVIGNVTTLPGLGGEGGRIDFMWIVHGEDVLAFATKRLASSEPMRWWEDVLGGGGDKIYPKDFKDAYPPL